MQDISAQMAQMTQTFQDLDPTVVKTGVAVGIGTAAFLVYLWHYRQSRKYNFPPGPPGRFLVGNAADVANNFKRLHLQFTDWSKEYGDVFSLNMMGKMQLVVSGKDAIRDATFLSPDVNDRPYFYRLHYLLDFQPDITFGSTSPHWTTMKKSALNSLKTYSDGLQRVEAFSHEILNDLLQNFADKKGEPFNPRLEIRDAITHFMSWLTFGDEMTKEELMQTRRVSFLVAKVMAAKGIGGLLDLAPWLRFIPNQCVRDMDEVILIIKSLYDKRLQNGKARYDPNDLKCSLDAMIKQQPESKLSDGDLRSILIDLIGAGTDTTSTTLHCFVALMANHPEIQKRAQEHINQAIGDDRLPLIADKTKLPYIEAMGWEVLRLMTPAPVVSRNSIKDTTFRGYYIPKDTLIWVNFWSMHHDEHFWEKPDEFRPERFIGDDGKVVPPDHPNRAQIMPFGAGRRVCIGETLARNRIFLFMTAFLQRFSFIPESPDNPPPADPKKLELGVILTPMDFNIRAVAKEK